MDITKMYFYLRIIVLAIFAILTFATADSQIKPKECLKVPVKQNFEPQKVRGYRFNNNCIW